MKSVKSVEAHLGFWLRFVSNHVSGRFARLLEERGLRVAEWVALRTLYGEAGGTHTDLILTLGMTKGATSKVITKLEEKGLVERYMAENSAKEQRLVLTASGKRVVPELVLLADENEEYFFGHLHKSEMATLMKLMKGLVEHHQFKQVPTK